MQLYREIVCIGRSVTGLPKPARRLRACSHTRGVLDDRFDEVLAAARSGDVEAFGELWQATQPMLLRYLRVRAGEHAEDVASQTWLRIIEGLDRFRGDETGFRRWAVTVARNTHVDLLRRLSRRPEHAVEDISAVTGQAPAPDAADVAESREATRSAIALLATLPPEQAEMVALRVIVGLDVAEVAQITGRSPGAVRVAVHRALRRLRQALDPEEAPVTDGSPLAFSRHDD